MNKPDGTKIGLQKVLSTGWRRTTYIRPDGSKFHINVPPLEIGEDGKTPTKWDEGAESELYEYLVRKTCRCSGMCHCSQPDEQHLQKVTQGTPLPGRNLAPGFMSSPTPGKLKVKCFVAGLKLGLFTQEMNDWLQNNAVTVRHVHSLANNVLLVWYEEGEELRK